MFTSKFLIFVLAALIATVAAGTHTPRRHHRRGTCPKRLPSTTAVTLPGTTAPAVIPDSSTKSSSAVVVQPTTSRIVTSRISSGTPVASPTGQASSSATSKPASPSDDAPSPAPTGTIGGLLGNLFPVGRGIKSWSASPASPNALPLSDSTLRPEKVMSSVPHFYQSAPDGKRAMMAKYPKGSYTFGNSPQGGFSFYAPGPPSVDLTTAKEATFGYSVFFPRGFDFVKGGKLPGFYGGNTEEGSVSCSGGRRSDECFSVRLMWRAESAGEFYTYLPPSRSENQRFCSLPGNHCNDVYGASIGTGKFHFATGAWTTVSERVKLNDIGQANGEIELFANGKSVIRVNNLVLRTSQSGKIRGMQFQTFFGGSKPDFASTKDQEVFFSDFSVAITESL